jgi:cobalamin synthase
MASWALAFGGAGALLLLNTFLWSAACLADAGDNSPHCGSRWFVPAGAAVFIPLVALCAACALATARGAWRGRRLSRRERRLVIVTLVVLTLFGLLAVPFGVVLVPFAWLVVAICVLLVRGIAAVVRSISSRRCPPARS